MQEQYDHAPPHPDLALDLDHVFIRRPLVEGGRRPAEARRITHEGANPRLGGDDAAVAKGGGMDGDDVLLRADGAHLVTDYGSRVTLRGVGLGGWMNTENFLTGYPSAESLQLKELRT